MARRRWRIWRAEPVCVNGGALEQGREVEQSSATLLLILARAGRGGKPRARCRRRESSLYLAPRPSWASAAMLRAHAAVGMHSDIAAPSRTAIATVPPPPLGRADALRRRRSHAQARAGLCRPSIAPPPRCRRLPPLLLPYAMSTLKSCPRGRPYQLLTLLVSILDLDEIT